MFCSPLGARKSPPAVVRMRGATACKEVPTLSAISLLRRFTPGWGGGGLKTREKTIDARSGKEVGWHVLLCFSGFTRAHDQP